MSARSTLRFYLERWLQRGILAQLLAMAALILLVAVLGGLAAWALTPGFEGPGQAIWWAFLRLTDPGYLGDDQGLVLRTISTVVTVLGYVLFMGSLIAILTQGLSGALRRMESGVTPIALEDHVILLGWTNRTAEVVLRLLSGRGRLKRFLERSETGRLHVVVTADRVGPEHRLELREHLGPLYRTGQIFLRSASTLQVEHLQRLDPTRAAAILLPAADYELGGSELTDARVLKALMTLEGLLAELPVERRPLVVAEIFDSERAPLAEATMSGPLEVVASNRIVARLIFQSVRRRGLAQVLFGVLSYREGNSVYLRSLPELVGTSLSATAERFQRAVPLGLVRGEGPDQRALLDPSSDEEIQVGDQLILLAEVYEDCVACKDTPPLAHPSTLPNASAGTSGGGASGQPQRILILGWSHKVLALLRELGEDPYDRFQITILSRVDVASRQQEVARLGLDPESTSVHQVEGDSTLSADLLALNPEDFDQVALVASGGMASSEEADARTLLSYALLRSLLVGSDNPPELLVELLDPANAPLLDGRGDTVLVTPRLVSHVLAHVTLRPELNAVFEALFGARGSEFDLWPAAPLGLLDQPVTFPEVQAAARAQGLAALGLRTQESGTATLHMNPPRDRSWTLGPKDRVVVLANEEALFHA